MKAQKGFTLVEILIVVVILGILAAIVIPQFTDASTEAKVSSLCSDLQTVRSQIELYKIQHNDNLPGVANAPMHPSGIGDFAAAMTSKTDVYGDAGTDFGPYLQKIPVNPFNNRSNVRTVTVNPTTAADSAGWWYNTVEGDFGADDLADPCHVGL
jgi:general secretion pathway protein G